MVYLQANIKFIRFNLNLLMLRTSMTTPNQKTLNLFKLRTTKKTMSFDLIYTSCWRQMSALLNIWSLSRKKIIRKGQSQRMLTVTVTNGEVTYIRQLVFLVFAQKKWGKGHFKGFTIHTSFPSSMQIISVMNIQQCISFHKDPTTKMRPTDICKQQFQFLVQNGEKKERQSGQAIHPPKKAHPSSPTAKRTITKLVINPDKPKVCR